MSDPTMPHGGTGSGPAGPSPGATGDGYRAEAPTRAEVDALGGRTLLDFGADWCGFCRGARPHVDAALAAAGAGLRHLRIEDGKGRPLGRSFRVKLWPTLVLLEDGRELGRVVRPRDAAEVEALLRAS